MSLIKALGLKHPAARPAAGAASPQTTRNGGTSTTPMPMTPRPAMSASPMQPMTPTFGRAPPADEDTDDGMGEQVRIDGQTAAMLELRATKARAIVARAKVDLDGHYKNYHGVEAKLEPWAKKIETAMKVPPKTIAAEIARASKNTDLRRLGTDADQAKELLEDVGSMQRLVRTLIHDAQDQIGIANDAIRANKTVNDAADLKERVAQVKEGIEKFLKVTEIVLNPEEAGLKIVSMAASWAVDASSLKERSEELSKLAREETADVLKKSLERVVALSSDLSDQVIDLKKKVVHRAANAARLAKEAEDAFNKINKDGKFHFDGFDLGVKAAQASFDLLNEAASHRRDAIQDVAAIDHWLHSHHDAGKQSGGLQLKGDPMKVGKAMAALQARLDAGRDEVKKLLVDVRSPLEGLEIDVTMARRRLDRWTDFYVRTQQAMFEAAAPQ
jgi:hypothetical protein